MTSTIERTAFHQFTYGLFLLSSQANGRDNACIINTAIQSASQPRQVSVSVIKNSCTQEYIESSGLFCVSVLTQQTPKNYFDHFGLKSGHDTDKFFQSEETQLCDTPGANPTHCDCGLVYEKSASAFFACKVLSQSDLGSHILYTGEVIEAQTLSQEAAIDYNYYQKYTKHGIETSTLQDKEETGETESATQSISAWKCSICGYIYEGSALPEDFICPLCKHGSEDFEPVYSQVEDKDSSETVTEKGKGETVMDKWVCKVCGYVYEGAEAPAQCPQCKASSENFSKVEGEMTLAAEHEYGIYAKTVKNNDAISAEDKAYILEQLKANFSGECSEVGMYLCMARIAHREGYPEVGLYWEKAAYEEAEHAAKFAELLGEELEPNMKACTKANLAWRVDCEFGATAGKTELAACAKKNGLDAIHDTVHEMARDEARHGKALKGLLDRYFA